MKMRKGNAMKKSFIMAAVVIAVTLSAFVFFTQNGQSTESETVTPQTEQTAEQATTQQSAETTTESAKRPPVESEFETLEVKALGNPEAPVVVEEFASFSCSHCAAFHTETFPELKEKYIDTGKIYFVFNEFALNGPAFEATIVARCLPEQHYFNFVSFLFEKQKDWAFGPDYKEKLAQNAKLVGLSSEKLEECRNNQAMKDDLVARLRKASKMYGITSTPSFLINGELLSGNQPFEAFEAAIDKKLNEE